ncbi:MAG: SGNH/GDSL hydrolase family protein [Pseudomonadales bacterium]
MGTYQCFQRVVGTIFFLIFNVIHIQAQTFSDCVVFGDSLSDSGNLAGIINDIRVDIPPPFGPLAEIFYFRNSDGELYNTSANGHVFAENLCELLGYTLTPGRAEGSYTVWVGPFPVVLNWNSSDGSNYAFSGAAAVGDTSETELFDLSAQVDSFVEMNEGAADANHLYIISIGANDILFKSGDTYGNIDSAVSEISSQIERLHTAGARNFLVPNMPDLSLTPDHLDDPTLFRHAKYFNDQLSIEMSSLSSLEQIHIVEPNEMEILNQIIASERFIDTTSTACTVSFLIEELLLLPGGTVIVDEDRDCDGNDLDAFVWFDGIHLTSAAHQALSDAFYLHTLVGFDHVLTTTSDEQQFFVDLFLLSAPPNNVHLNGILSNGTIASGLSKGREYITIHGIGVDETIHNNTFILESDARIMMLHYEYQSAGSPQVDVQVWTNDGWIPLTDLPDLQEDGVYKSLKRDPNIRFLLQQEAVQMEGDYYYKFTLDNISNPRLGFIFDSQATILFRR